ncbi:MAG: BA14K family protein [Hyphomicrobiaceae bacterium]|nr:BA14K family protein [Hyphomicrobiaceae bacterium]
MTRTFTRSVAALAATTILAISMPATAFADAPAAPRAPRAETAGETIQLAQHWRRDERRDVRRDRRDFRRDRRDVRRERRDVRRHRGGNDDLGAAIVGGIIGLTVGAILTAPRQPAYPQGYQGGYGRNPTVIEHRPEPFTADWYAYCASRYRSFDPATGTFQPYEGPRQLCR